MIKSIFYPINALVITLCCGLSTAIASEQSELAQAIRQLNAAEQALTRAQNQAKTEVKHRFYFDYPSARADINKVRIGINNYINSERALPRNPKQLKDLSGDYERNRGE
ncbi:TPA: RAQPRD family integrative conjugative element protein [Pasteurella multocida]|uniref:integrative conjugative element protein, RAQPRD family n=1 Tax=Pasteurella multocida TaxID=747 RepID=UPI002020BB3B|nr:RAQPRD family integrative conjugative element protein [Pasteurella multocida]MCL7827376.1 RAQPRD family integrative conjugative element protein [Pasteurella multocida]HDR1435562.1 RAQPRD family integrative conjugative element protein [Pasteurella multocida]HDR1793420.1 RAQPRD family integrative conjugative element protein [Pasteurella multocida]HDR1868175.1 RAQPRD family integrative conjugative element protein [Pasteurella multocida]HED4416802.1 RAQPRD family integrative conjugative element